MMRIYQELRVSNGVEQNECTLHPRLHGDL